MPMPKVKEDKYTYESQCGQDMFLIHRVFRRRKRGYFVDVGAHDGVFISNTCTLENDFGWSGICIEPSTASTKIMRSRGKSKVVVACVCDNSHDNQIVKLRERSPMEISQTMYDDNDEKYVHEPNKFWDKFKICKTLNRILLENDAPKNIDYISIDVEGTEYMVIKDFPFSDWNITAITIANNFYEGTEEKKENRTNIKSLLEKNGFVLMKEFTLHELDKENWGEKFDDQVLEDLYVSKDFAEKKKLKIM